MTNNHQIQVNPFESIFDGVIEIETKESFNSGECQLIGKENKHHIERISNRLLKIIKGLKQH